MSIYSQCNAQCYNLTLQTKELNAGSHSLVGSLGVHGENVEQTKNIFHLTKAKNPERHMRMIGTTVNVKPLHHCRLISSFQQLAKVRRI